MTNESENMYCGAIKRGEVFICDLAGKKAWALVLQDNVLNGCLPTVVCAPIEPRKKTDRLYINEVVLPGVETGLGKDGICLPYKIISIDRRRIIAKKGEVSKEKMAEVYQALDITLGRFRDKKF
ncbi:type II toxin-antitoxin system PemK/MazF family toxin [Patescibacteria group bacterium]|nr:MAG: type II toxin-antitoxin system PemK/MazF family toxin [Patescibacteria group bacterium]